MSSAIANVSELLLQAMRQFARENPGYGAELLYGELPPQSSEESAYVGYYARFPGFAKSDTMLVRPCDDAGRLLAVDRYAKATPLDGYEDLFWLAWSWQDSSWAESNNYWSGPWLQSFQARGLVEVQVQQVIVKARWESP